VSVSDGLDVARRALAGGDAWLVGGAVRDRLLGAPPSTDLDVVVDGDPRAAAEAVAREAGRGAARFALSEAFGAWRVVGPGHAWQVDLTQLHGGGLDEDLRRRDLTINAIAQPLAGGELVDPTGGQDDLRAGVVRAVSDQVFADDPLRCLRVVRFAVWFDMAIDPATAELARRDAGGLDAVAGERAFAELRGLLASQRPRSGIELAHDLGVLAMVLPELVATRGVEQNRFHNTDVWTHTLDVLDAVVEIGAAPGESVGQAHANAVRDLLAEPLADEVDRGMALRWGALLHDIAKPQTRTPAPGGGTLGFPGHDVEGERAAREILRRLRASERLQGHVAALARHHLKLGFLVHHQPVARRTLHRYLVATEPVEADVTLLSVADRLATRGDNAEEATARHLELATTILDEALRWRAGETRPAPLVRGDELAVELGIERGPEIGRLLAELAEAQFAGEIATRADAIAAARTALHA
jgi:putative nucleotidyltransferase with HDIG domain